MAVGLGKIFGFHFPQNFNAPFISGSMTEFWRRWHISLGSWFRDYVYIPLGGNRNGRMHQMIYIFIVWLLTGLWHGAEWNFMIWGLFFAVLISAEKLFKKKRGFFSHIYFLFFIIISFVIFHAQNLTQAISDIGGLFGVGGIAFVTKETLYYLRSFGVILMSAILCTIPFTRDIQSMMKSYQAVKKAAAWIEPAALLALMIVISAYLVDSSFHPFLYFRF